MIRKILLFTVFSSTAVSAGAQINSYCISSEKLAEIQETMSEQTPDMQNAYNELFDIMLANNESASVEQAGCVSTQDFAQICKDNWNEATEQCETFVYAVVQEPAKQNLKVLSVSMDLTKTDFSDIDPDIFNKAVNKAVARRRDKNIPSKLENMGYVFLEHAKEQHLNPFISAAISLYESNRGTSNIARTKNNIAGLGGPGKWMAFPSVADSIQTQANTLKTNVSKGRQNLNTLACSGKYCATNTNSWYVNVSSVTKELYRHYNALLQGQN